AIPCKVRLSCDRVCCQRNSHLYHNLILTTTILVLFSVSPSIIPKTNMTSPVNALLTGLKFPVPLRFAPDGRIFYTEKDTGNIRIIQQNGALLPTPFATVNPIFNTGEAGLLGIALDPAFSSNNYVYVYYTYRDRKSVV